MILAPPGRVRTAHARRLGTRPRRRGLADVAVVRRDLIPRAPMSRDRWYGSVEYRRRTCWTDSANIRMVREKAARSIPAGGYTGTPGPGVIFVIPHQTVLHLSICAGEPVGWRQRRTAPYRWWQCTGFTGFDYNHNH
jgi:hypothetical protein